MWPVSRSRVLESRLVFETAGGFLRLREKHRNWKWNEFHQRPSLITLRTCRVMELRLQPVPDLACFPMSFA